MRTRLLAAPLLVLGSLAAAPALQEEALLRDSDHKKLGKEIAAYYEAKEQKKGIEAAFSDASEAMDKLEKKLKKVPVLAAVEDWEQALWFAQQETYDDKVKKGKTETESFDSFSGKVELAYHAPKKYSYKRGPFPLVLVVPDAGEKPADHIDGHWADISLQDAALIVAVDMPTDVDTWGRFDPREPTGVTAVMTAYAVAKENFAVDMDRVYLAGSGKGFAAAAATASAFPQLFAGLIGRGEIPAADGKNFRNLPTLLLSPSEGARALEAQIEELGYGNLKRVPDGAVGDVNAFVETPRAAYPQKITFVPFNDYTRATQWVNIEGFQADQNPRIDVSVDRASNTVTIDADAISTVTVYLNDRLVDMDAPVKLLINGTAHEELVPRNRRYMLDLAFNSGDWGRVFTGFITRDVPVRTSSKE